MNNEQDMKDQQQAHALYQSLPKDLPPPELDARILQAAHQAVNAKNTRVVSLGSKRSKTVWFRPLAYAAVLVLCLGIVLRIQLDTPEQIAPKSAAPEAMMDEVINEAHYAVPAPLQPASDAAEPARKKVTSARKEKSELSAPVVEMKAGGMQSPRREINTQEDGRAGKQSVQITNELSRSPPVASPIRNMADSAAMPMSATESELPAEADKVSVDIEQDVARMMQLYKNNNIDQLLVQLKLFLTKYPGYELPVELKKIAIERSLQSPAAN